MQSRGANSAFGHESLHQRPGSGAAQGFGRGGRRRGTARSVQQQILPRVVDRVGYTSRWLTNFTWERHVSCNAPATPELHRRAPTLASPTLGDSIGPDDGLLYSANPERVALTHHVTKLATDAGGIFARVTTACAQHHRAARAPAWLFQGGRQLRHASAPILSMCARLTGVHVIAAHGRDQSAWWHTSRALVTRYTGLASYTIAL